MKVAISQGYGSEYVVLDARTKVPLSDVVLIFPLLDKAALCVLQEIVKDGDACSSHEIMQAVERYEKAWETIENMLQT